MNSRKK